MDPWIPTGLPPTGVNYEHLFNLANSATAAVCKFDGIMTMLHQPGLLLLPLMTEEAVMSSRIEETYATLEEVYEARAGTADPSRRLDIEEVTNYVRALQFAHTTMREQPISVGLVRECHKVLMTGVRGADKSPGEIRLKQNYIGAPGSTMESATFVPPTHVGLDAHLREWQDFLRRDDMDPIVQTAIMHAYFECLHPFEDGNGRVGRLLIPYQLYWRKTMSNATFFLSGYLEKNRPEYYHRLVQVTASNDWTGWIDFFLRAVHAQASENIVRGQGLVQLHRRTHERVPQIVASRNSSKLVEFMFTAPIFSIANLVAETQIPAPTAQTLVRALVADGMLRVHQAGSGRRPATYMFGELFEAMGHRDAVTALISS